VVRFNRSFHLALVRPGGRQITAQVVERLQVLAERYVRKHLEPAGREARAASEHRAILDAWLQRDAALVSRLLSEHILTTLHDLRVQLEQIGPDEPAKTPRRRRRVAAAAD
ncbi:FCD domain-containing protein, partial [Lysobacter sp. 2RAB21]